ncbi:MAG TPA: DUF5327 family protein [Pseudogracilibacillus sp.]|nr:DUF5327 family protein [Pseudogracilibacillus sp.]
MSVANETIINKMMHELKVVKEEPNNKEKMMKHVGHVKLLCELLLEEERPLEIQKNKITAEEMKAMMGQNATKSLPSTSGSKSSIDHDDANGESIFDF